MSDIAKSIKNNNQSISTNSIVTNTQKTGLYSSIPDAENRTITPSDISAEIGKRFNRKRTLSGASTPEQPAIPTWNLTVNIPATIDVTMSRLINEFYKTNENLVGQPNESYKSINIYIFGNGNFTINWGDGVIENFISGGAKTHEYSVAGTYIVRINGSFSSNTTSGNIKIGFSPIDKYYFKSTSVIPYIANLDNFSSTFENCIGLTSLPNDLFINFPNLSSSKAFTYTFKGCTNLTSIPANLFRYNTEIYFNGFLGTFFGCSGLTSVPADLFRYNTKLNKLSFISTFKNCGISTIPSDLFRYNTEITTGFNHTFESCTNLTTIPAGLFRYNTKVTSGFNAIFMNCTNLSAVDADIFRYNTQLFNSTNTSLKDVFSGVVLPSIVYSNILISLNTYTYLGNNLQFNAGNSVSDANGLNARSSLISKNWNIIDGSNLLVYLDATNTSSINGVSWNDLSGKGHHAKLINGAYHQNNSIVFDGINDYAEIKNSALVNNCLNSNFTFDIWVWIDINQVRPYGKIFSKGGYFAPGFNGVTLSKNGSIVSATWQYRTSNGSVINLISTVVPTNTWINLVYTRSDGVIKCYLNGQEVSSANNTYDLRSTYNLRIGSNYQPDNQAKQIVRKFAQYNIALSANEILTNYNNSAAV